MNRIGLGALLLCCMQLAAGSLAAQGAGPEPVRRLLDGVRGATPVQCELALRSFSFWSDWDGRVPDRDETTVRLLRWAHGTQKDPAIVAPLAAGLRDTDACVQRMAARLLGRTRLPAARARLVEALRDRDARVRVLGAVGLGYTDDKTAIPLLVQALKDGDPKVRAAAAWALGAIH